MWCYELLQFGNMVLFINGFGQVVVEVFYGVVVVFIGFEIFMDKGLEFFYLFQVLIFVEDFINDGLDVVQVYFFVVFIFQQLVDQWFFGVVDMQEWVYFLQIFEFEVRVNVCIFVIVEVKVEVKYDGVEFFLIVLVEVVVFVVVFGVVVEVGQYVVVCQYLKCLVYIEDVVYFFWFFIEQVGQFDEVVLVIFRKELEVVQVVFGIFVELQVVEYVCFIFVGFVFYEVGCIVDECFFVCVVVVFEEGIVNRFYIYK